MSPCDFCGKLTSWDVKFVIPPCCKECRWIPLTVGISTLLAVVGMLVAVHFALRAS